MQQGPLIGLYETRLMGWGSLALVLAVALRLGFGYLTARQFWLLDSQLFWVPLLLALCIFAGLFVGGAWSRTVTAVLGLACWMVALTLLPWPNTLRYLWWQSPTLRQPVPEWLWIAALAVLAGALITRGVMTRLWLSQVRGHGFQWILNWAAGRSYFARLLAVRVLASLGYQG